MNRTVSSFKYTGQTSVPGSSQQSASKGGWEDLLPGIGGIVGGTVGHIAGVPLGDVETASPIGSMALGAGLSGLGGGIGETVRQVVHMGKGEGFDPAQIGKTALEQAAFGAIPGGQEIKALRNIPGAARVLAPLATEGIPGIAARTAARFGTGYVGGTVAGLAQGQPLGKASEQGLGSGLVSSAIPAVTGAAETAAKLPSFLGRQAVSAAHGVIERNIQPFLDQVQNLFGKEAIRTTPSGTAMVRPEVEKVIEEYKIPVPMLGGNLAKFRAALNKAGKSIEDKITPLFAGIDAPVDDIDKILQKNLQNTYGTGLYRSRLAAIPAPIRTFMSKIDSMMPNEVLSEVRNLQKLAGDNVIVKNWDNIATPQDKFFANVWSDLKEYIAGAIPKDNAELAHYLQQHAIVAQAKNAYDRLTGSSGTLPLSVTSKEMGQLSTRGQLGAERLKEMALRHIPGLAATAGSVLFPGLPPAARFLIGAYGLSTFGPELNPQVAKTIGRALQRPEQAMSKLAGSNEVQQALQQLGIRLP